MSQSLPKEMAAKALAALYWWTCIAFWAACFVEIFLHRSAPDQGVLKVLGIWAGALLFAWHPTGDAVLNFLLDAVLCVIALALVPGIFVVGFYLVIACILMAMIGLLVSGLVALWKVSLTGAIISTAVCVVLITLLARRLPAKLGDALRPVGNALFGVFGVRLARRATHYSSSSDAGGYGASSRMRGGGHDGAHAQRKSSGRGPLGVVTDVYESLFENSEQRAERCEAAFKAGGDEARQGGIVDGFFHIIGDAIGTVTPSTKEHQSHEAGYHGKERESKKK
jgi:hypothetical protein